MVWSKKVDSLDVKKDKTYIIHQILRFGSLADWRILKQLYTNAEVHQAFLHQPLKIYSKPSLRFVKDIVLGLKNAPIDEQRYLQAFH